ncbi:MAG TPA: Gfo/Idh/MocA family oxidoreductase [Anaerolineaceae bacterium]
MRDKLRVGVVGCGIGKTHVHGFRQYPDRFEVLAMCDINADRAKPFVEQAGIPRFTTRYDELLRMDDIDVIDLCTPTFLHHDQTLAALAAHKYVILEKPAAGSLKDVDHLIAVELQSDRRIMPIFQYRFGAGAQRLRHLVDTGIAGRAYLGTAETAWRRRMNYYSDGWHGKWQTELGGVLVTLAVHAHDVVNYILGPARSVFARTATLVNPIETEDTISASLLMADGSLCSLSATTGSSEQITRHRFCFSNLVAESNREAYRNTTDPWTFVGDTPELNEQIQQALAAFTPRPEGFAGMFLGFSQALETGGAFPVTLQDARRSLELITAIYDSARRNQPVDLPIGSDHPLYAGWQPKT